MDPQTVFAILLMIVGGWLIITSLTARRRRLTSRPQPTRQVASKTEAKKLAVTGLRKKQTVVYQNLTYTVTSRVQLKSTMRHRILRRFDLVDIDGTKLVLFVRASSYGPFELHMARPHELPPAFSNPKNDQRVKKYRGRRYEPVPEQSGDHFVRWLGDTGDDERSNSCTLTQFRDVEASVPGNEHLANEEAPFCERFGAAAWQTYLRKPISLADIRVES